MYLTSLPMYAFDGYTQDRRQWVDELLMRVDMPRNRVKWQENVDNLIEHWSQSNLLISQTCGFPLVKLLSKKVQIIGTLAYSASGCNGTDYCSAIIAKRSDPRSQIEAFSGASLVINEWGSQSGFNALRLYLKNRGLLGHSPFFKSVKCSHSHRQSVAQVASGEAQIASIDCVTLAFMRREYPELIDDVKVIAMTEKYPGLPLITAVDTPLELVLQIRQAITDMVSDVRLAELNARLLVSDFRVVPLQEYERRIILPDNALQQL